MLNHQGNAESAFIIMMNMEVIIMIIVIVVIIMIVIIVIMTTMAKSDDGGGFHPRTTFPALPPGKMRGHTFRQDDHHQHAGHDHHLVALWYERHFHQADRGDCLNALNSPHVGFLGLWWSSYCFGRWRKGKTIVQRGWKKTENKRRKKRNIFGLRRRKGKKKKRRQMFVKNRCTGMLLLFSVNIGASTIAKNQR